MGLEDVLANLQSKVGTEIHVSDWAEITQDMVNAFGNATGDMQWIHTDPERAAAESPYKTTIAHGYLTLSMMTFLGDQAAPPGPNPFEAVTVRINYGLNKVRFMSPVKVNSAIRLQRILVRQLRNQQFQKRRRVQYPLRRTHPQSHRRTGAACNLIHNVHQFILSPGQCCPCVLSRYTLTSTLPA